MAEPFDDEIAGLGDVGLELERIGRLADGVERALSRTFRSALTEGKSLKGLLADIAESFADIALRAALKPLTGFLGGLVEQVFTATNPALGGVTPFAKGGVVAAPTFFPLGPGLGLAGEAGAEAILPLSRGSDGRLGVAAPGGSPVAVTFNVTASDARSFLAAEAEIGAMLLRAVRRGARGA